MDTPTKSDLEKTAVDIWDDDTVMPWGKHVDKRLSDVPDQYFEWLLDQAWIDKWPALMTYAHDRVG